MYGTVNSTHCAFHVVSNEYDVFILLMQRRHEPREATAYEAGSFNAHYFGISIRSIPHSKYLNVASEKC